MDIWDSKFTVSACCLPVEEGGKGSCVVGGRHSEGFPAQKTSNFFAFILPPSPGEDRRGREGRKGPLFYYYDAGVLSFALKQWAFEELCAKFHNSFTTHFPALPSAGRFQRMATKDN